MARYSEHSKNQEMSRFARHDVRHTASSEGAPNRVLNY